MKNIKLTPLADRVLIKANPIPEKHNGIIIPDTAKEKPQRGIVVAVGKGTKDEPIALKIGDVVIYGKYSGTEISQGGEDLLIMRESDIFGIIQPK